MSNMGLHSNVQKVSNTKEFPGSYVFVFLVIVIVITFRYLLPSERLTAQLRLLLMQGRIFLSARILGFYANFFGHKTKVFFLWEDIEDIQVLPPSLSSMGSPSLVIILREGRGVDARHGAKAQDEEGRFRFHFHSFVSFSEAYRYTVMK